jgi:hypothetical protein
MSDPCSSVPSIGAPAFRKGLACVGIEEVPMKGFGQGGIEEYCF